MLTFLRLFFSSFLCLSHFDRCDRAFHVPLVTPVELQIALGVREWQANLDTDLRAVIETSELPPIEELEASEDNQVIKFESAAALRFADRDYQGLVPTIHAAITDGSEDVDDEAALSYEIQQGHVGIASSYHGPEDSSSSSR